MAIWNIFLVSISPSFGELAKFLGCHRGADCILDIQHLLSPGGPSSMHTAYTSSLDHPSAYSLCFLVVKEHSDKSSANAGNRRHIIPQIAYKNQILIDPSCSSVPKNIH